MHSYIFFDLQSHTTQQILNYVKISLNTTPGKWLSTYESTSFPFRFHSADMETLATYQLQVRCVPHCHFNHTAVVLHCDDVKAVSKSFS